MTTLTTYTPQQIAEMLEQRAIVLVDVREEGEYAAEHIEGAILCPLSAFDPSKLPDAGEKKIVFHCAHGMRSAKAVAKCLASRLPHAAHMEGGIKAWKSAGLPTVR
ncbi:MAG: rhodanese-like domain-containing protein [Alphaproteobacteria bacterium]|nr:rhodanese-like domain-containing protein [Alphaproteobacteria bacterium]